jgi:erythromycin esterase
MIGAMTDVFAGRGLAGDASVRDRFMADTLLWHLDQAPQDKIVVVAHNNHVQKTAVVFDGEFAAYPLGYYLHQVLRADYRAVALTHTADRVPEMAIGSGELGFTLVDTAVAPPSPGSVERFLLDLGLGDQVTLTSLRPAADVSRQNGFSRIRVQSEEQELDVADAFDGVLSVPSTTESFATHL